MCTDFYFYIVYNNIYLIWKEVKYGQIKNRKNSKTNDSVTRTIRISGRTFDKINELATENEISFNCVVNQIIEFGLHNLDEK